MQKATTTLLFLWARGKRERWKTRRAVVEGWPDVQVIYTARWPSLTDEDANTFAPLTDPHIYEAFADVARIARDAAARFENQAGGSLPEPIDPDPMVTARHRAAFTVAVDSPEVIAAVLRFVRDYGPLDLSESWAMEPVTDEGETFLRSHERWLSGRRFLMLAAELGEAIRFAADDKPYPRWLNDVMNEHLRGVHPVSFNASDLGTRRGAYAFTCDSLLAALWWQFYQHDAGGAAWRICEGCQRIFAQSRKDQKYHDKNCRNRTNVAKAAKKSSQKGEQHD